MKQRREITIQRGVKQGDVISPSLFNAALEEIFRKLDWEELGIKIDGKYLNNLRFADDIVLIASTPNDLQKMINELNEKSNEVGLTINLQKTKIMARDTVSISLGHEQLQQVNKYIYLGQHFSLQDQTQIGEINRRISAGWAAYTRCKEIFKGKFSIQQKRRVFNQCVIPAMTYGAETWTFHESIIQRLQVAQRKMERRMLNISYRERRRNAEIRSISRLEDVLTHIRKMKWTWAGHISRYSDDRWTKRLTEWTPYGRRRQRGSPRRRWRQELDEFFGSVNWAAAARCRKYWRSMCKTYARTDGI
jgi:hypothetical protein